MPGAETVTKRKEHIGSKLTEQACQKLKTIKLSDFLSRITVINVPLLVY